MFLKRHWNFAVRFVFYQAQARRLSMHFRGSEKWDNASP